MPRLLVMLLLVAASTAGCADEPAPPAEIVAEAEPAVPVTYKAFEGQRDWPIAPGAAPTTLEFEVPANATAVNVAFSWRGMQPGGYSSSRGAVLIDAAGAETILADGDLPANPYACANPRCGPEDRDYDFDMPAPGTWTLRLDGAFTATAVLSVTVTATA